MHQNMNSRNQISVRIANIQVINLNIEVINFHTPWITEVMSLPCNIDCKPWKFNFASKDLYFHSPYKNTCFLDRLTAASHMYINVCSYVGAYFLLLFCILPFCSISSISDLIHCEILRFHFHSIKIIFYFSFYFFFDP